MQTSYTLPKQHIYTVGANSGNEITKSYYNHLVGEINRGAVLKAVCSIERFNHVSYYLISI